MKKYKKWSWLTVTMLLTWSTLSAQKTITMDGQGNIQSDKYLTPKRRGAEKFESGKGSEHLFFSVASGTGYLFDMGGGLSANGMRASLQAGNWFTPVVGIRGGAEYGMWKGNGMSMNLTGVSMDYLINISAFAARYNPKRVFEVVAAIGMTYQATMAKGTRTVHSYGLRAGLQGKFNISPAFNLFIEPQLAIYPDRVDRTTSWRHYDLGGSIMAGITYKPSGFSKSKLLQNGFASLAVGTGKTGNILFNTEFAIGKWFDRTSGIRISTGSSSAFKDNSDSKNPRDFNINLNADYLCNLTYLLSEKKTKEQVFDLLLIGGIGSYFPGSDSSAPVIMNGRIGLQGQIRLSAHCGLWIEPRLNIFQDKTFRADMQKAIRGTTGLMIGTSYRF